MDRKTKARINELKDAQKLHYEEALRMKHKLTEFQKYIAYGSMDAFFSGFEIFNQSYDAYNESITELTNC